MEDLLTLARPEREDRHASRGASGAREVVDEILRQMAPLIEAHGSAVTPRSLDVRLWRSGIPKRR